MRTSPGYGRRYWVSRGARTQGGGQVRGVARRCAVLTNVEPRVAEARGVRIRFLGAYISLIFRAS